jgi:hypothetical protein
MPFPAGGPDQHAARRRGGFSGQRRRRRGARAACQAYPPDTPGDFATFIRADTARWQTVVREARIELQG